MQSEPEFNFKFIVNYWIDVGASIAYYVGHFSPPRNFIWTVCERVLASDLNETEGFNEMSDCSDCLVCIKVKEQSKERMVP